MKSRFNVVVASPTTVLPSTPPAKSSSVDSASVSYALVFQLEFAPYAEDDPETVVILAVPA